MPFQPFTKASTNHPKGKSMPPAPLVKQGPPSKGKPVAVVISGPPKGPMPKANGRIPKPSGAGPAGSAGYFDC